MKFSEDHTQSTAALQKALASSAGAATPPANTDQRIRGLIENLEKAGPVDFDKTYMDQQVAAHNEAVALFKGYSDHGDTDALKAFATRTTPTIQSHLAMAKQLRGALK